jgi:hypothetical protein
MGIDGVGDENPQRPSATQDLPADVESQTPDAQAQADHPVRIE